MPVAKRVHQYHEDGRTKCGLRGNAKRMGRPCGNCIAVEAGTMGGRRDAQVGRYAPDILLGLRQPGRRS